MITTPLGPEFGKNDDQSGAKSGDHTHRVKVSMSRSMRSASTAPTSTLVWPRCRGTTSTLRRHPTSGIDGGDLFEPAQTGFAVSIESFDSLNGG